MKAIRNLRDVPDEHFLTLLKAIKECPKTWQELEKKSVKPQAAYDVIDRPQTLHAKK